jgi:EmrB/QacA subfamily drug resistance transporter
MNQSSGSRRWWALAALSVAMLTVGLDSTVLTVALPTLAKDLEASTSQLQWFSGAYTLVLAAVLLPAGAIGDRSGRKRLLLTGLVVFAAASLWCAYSGSAPALIAARAALGLGAAIMMPLSLAVLPSIFPETAERARAFTIWVTSTAVGLPLGPILGGWLLEHFWWGSVFLINVPLVLIGGVAVAVFVPESRSDDKVFLDPPGVLLSTLGLLALTFGFIRAGQNGWGDVIALSMIAAGIVLLAGFAAWERSTAHPLVDLGLFASRWFSWGTAFATTVSFGLFGLLFAVPQFFQAVQGASELGTGVRLLPMIGGLLVGTRLADRVVKRTGARAVLAGGFVLLAIGLGIGATASRTTGYGQTAAWIAIVGVGLGTVLPSSMNAALGVLPPQRAGSGSALITALRQAGGTIGVAVLGTVLNSSYRSALGGLDKLPFSDSVSAGVAAATAAGRTEAAANVQSAFTHGMDVMLATTAGICALAAVLAVAVLPRRIAAQPTGGETESAEPDGPSKEGSAHVG